VGIMGVEVEDVEEDKRLRWKRENWRLSHTNTQRVCVCVCERERERECVCECVEETATLIFLLPLL